MLRTAAKWGTVAYVGNKAAKAYSERNTQQTPPPQPTYYPQQSSSRSQGSQIREANGYLHQTWCNGQCGMHCNDGAANNGSRDAGNVPRLGESEAYYGGFETRDSNKDNLPAYGK